MSSPINSLQKIPTDEILEGSENRTSMATLVEENTWTLYKYDFTRLEKRETLLDGFVVIESDVSTDEQLMVLLEQNKIDDNPAAPGRCNYCFFRRSITPVWQDPLNKFGGRIILKFYSALRITSDMLHEYWSNVLRLVFKRFRYSRYITGVKVHWWPRCNHAISLWTSRVLNHNEMTLMTEILKGIIIYNFGIDFLPHTAVPQQVARFISKSSTFKIPGGSSSVTKGSSESTVRSFLTPGHSSTVNTDSAGLTDTKKFRVSVDSIPGPSSAVGGDTSGSNKHQRILAMFDSTPGSSENQSGHFSASTKHQKILSMLDSTPGPSRNSVGFSAGPTQLVKVLPSYNSNPGPSGTASIEDASEPNETDMTLVVLKF